MSYLKAAFTARWNLLLFGGGVAAAFLSGFPGILLPLVLAGEVFYLASMLANDRFRSAVDAQDTKSRRAAEAVGAREAYERIRSKLPPQLLKRLPLQLAVLVNLYSACKKLASSPASKLGSILQPPARYDRMNGMPSLLLLSTQNGIPSLLLLSTQSVGQPALESTELRGRECNGAIPP